MKTSHFSKDDKLIIALNKKASSRTKGRVREHGPKFVFFKETKSFLGAGILSSRECILVGSTSTGWSGWLPVSEIEISKE